MIRGGHTLYAYTYNHMSQRLVHSGSFSPKTMLYMTFKLYEDIVCAFFHSILLLLYEQIESDKLYTLSDHINAFYN